MGAPWFQASTVKRQFTGQRARPAEYANYARQPGATTPAPLDDGGRPVIQHNHDLDPPARLDRWEVTADGRVEGDVYGLRGMHNGVLMGPRDGSRFQTQPVPTRWIQIMLEEGAVVDMYGCFYNLGGPKAGAERHPLHPGGGSSVAYPQLEPPPSTGPPPAQPQAAAGASADRRLE